MIQPNPTISMLRILLGAMLLAASPALAQEGTTPPIASGSAVRLFLRAEPARGVPAVVVSGSADTMRVVSPALGLAQVALDSLDRLEAGSSSRRELGKYALGIVGVSTAVGVLAEDDFFVPAFMNTAIALTLLGGVMYALDGPPKSLVPVDVRNGLPGGGVQPGPGARIRISTPDGPRVVRQLADFSPDSLYLAGEGGRATIPRAEVTQLQVAMGRDRRRGARTGFLVGGIGGGVLAGLGSASLGDWGLLLSPFAALFGVAVGGGLGAGTGYILAPTAWSDVPLGAPRR